MFEIKYGQFVYFTVNSNLELGIRTFRTLFDRKKYFPFSSTEPKGGDFLLFL